MLLQFCAVASFHTKMCSNLFALSQLKYLSDLEY